MQHAIDAESHDTEVSSRLDMDIRGALLKGVLPQPVDNAHDVLVIRVKLLVALAQVDELLEVGCATRYVALAQRALDRFGQVVKFHLKARDILRIGNHAADRPVQDRAYLGLPTALKRLGRGDDHLMRLDVDRQDAEARGIRAAHDFRYRREIDLERINMHIVQP